MDDGIDEGGQAFQPGNWNQCSDKIEAAVERFNDAVNQQVESEQQIYLPELFCDHLFAVREHALRSVPDLIGRNQFGEYRYVAALDQVESISQYEPPGEAEGANSRKKPSVADPGVDFVAQECCASHGQGGPNDGGDGHSKKNAKPDDGIGHGPIQES